MRVTTVAIERLMRNGYLRNTRKTPVRYVNAWIVQNAYRYPWKEAE